MKITALALILGAVIAISQQPAPRLDLVVREDFFAGLRGDKARFDRAIKTCEEILAREPKNPPALVWHGGGLYFQAGDAFRRGDTTAGMDLNRRGLQEMAEGVALQPDSPETRIPRGAILLGSAPYLSDDIAKPVIELAIGDYEKAMALQQPGFDRMNVHSKGELLGGLADGYRRLGNTAKSREYLDRLVRDLPGSAYEEQARRWLADLPAVGKREAFCLGCHTGSPAR